MCVGTWDGCGGEGVPTARIEGSMKVFTCCLSMTVVSVAMEEGGPIFNI